MAIGVVGMPGKIWIPPVGYVWTSSSAASPAAMFAGTSWAQIKDRFLMGAGGNYALGSTGGSTMHTLSVAEMPAHTHAANMGDAGTHTHTISRGWTNVEDENYNTSSAGGGTIFRTLTATTDAAGEHTHNVTIGSTGGGQAFSILNPYVGKYMWRRVS